MPLKTIITIITVIFHFGCDNEKAVYAYIVAKTTVEQEDTHDWRPVMRVIYYIKGDKIISEVASLVDEYEDCQIVDVKNWECEYEDGTGVNTFGFNDGKYWEKPGWGEQIKHVSRWEYNLIRCKWYQKEYGKIKGTTTCLKTYI